MSGVVETTLSGATAPYNYTTLSSNPNDVTIIDHTSGTVYGGVNASTIHGALSDRLTFIGGAGPTTVFGGSDATMFGGTSKTLMVGGVNVQETAVSGQTTMVAGTGNSTLVGAFGSGTESLYTNPNGSQSTLMDLNNAADTVIGGSGAASVFSGTGADVFGFVAGHAGGAETIYNLSASSTLVFLGYGVTPITDESVVGGSDVIKLTDGTTITLSGIDHKVFDGIGSSH